MKWINRDGTIILLNRGLRSFGYGFLSVILAIYLDELGFENLQIGLILSACILGGGFFTILTSYYSGKYGIKVMLLFSNFLTIVGVFFYIFTEQFYLLLSASFFGFISPSGRELGPYLSLEQAFLPSMVSEKDRTKSFSYYNIISTLSAAFGALIAALPTVLQDYFQLDKIISFKILFLFYGLLSITTFILYSIITSIELPSGKKVKLSPQTKRIVAKLSFLFGIDSFGGGFVIRSIVSFWFYTKFDVSITTISFLFFITGLLETLSFYYSAKLAKKIGLVKTMVYTHIPSNIFLILIPFMPSFYLAASFYFLRQLLSEMDIPARQSYVVAVVQLEERPIAAGITNVTRIITHSIGPTIATKILFSKIFSPFVIAGTLKIIYDLSLYYNFRHLKPPEEIKK